MNEMLNALLFPALLAVSVIYICIADLLHPPNKPKRIVGRYPERKYPR